MAKQEKHYEAIITWHKTLEKSDSDKVVIGDTDYASILYKKASAYEKLGFLYLAQKGYKEVLKIEPQHTLAKKHFKTYEKIQESYKLETIQKNIQQFITFEGIRNMETKISILKEIENTEYGNLVKQFAYKKTEEELKSLVIILNDLGYLTTKLGNLSETMEGELNVKLKYYTDAAIFYQYINTIINEKLNEITVEDKMTFITQQKIYPQEQLSHLQDLIFSAIVGTRETMPFFQQEKDNKQSLKKLRNDIDQKLQRAENIRKQAINNQEEKQKYQGLYVKEVINLFESIADEMRKFLGKLYSVSEQEIGRPPCKYAVIGLGSMALRQITPYSDLEFAILTENEDYKQSKDPKIKEYFKNLSHLVHFKVINLGESVIPTTRFSVDTSHLVRRGVNFDLGGKTPLGRIDNDKEYELVKTIDGMLVYVRNENNKAEHIDKNLPYILENVCYVHGDEQLVTSYKKEVTKFLTSKHESDEQGRLNCEIRALKLLEEGMIEIDYLQQTTSLNLKVTHFEGDLHRLAPKLGVENEGKLFDVKQEIYRLPDRLVYNLALYYGVEGDSNWDIVDKLKDENIISPEAAFNLKNAITFATTLRLKTYSYHKAQKEDMSIFCKSAETDSEIEEQAKQIFHLSEDDLREQGGLFQYFYTALPFHERLEAFCAQYKLMANADCQTFFQGSDFYVDDHANKGLIYYRLVKYQEAQSNLEQALNDPKNIGNLKLQNFLGMIYFRVNNYDRAIKWFDNCSNQLKLNYKEEPHPDVARSLNNLGLAYSAKGQYDQAMKYFEDSAKMRKLIYKEEPHQDLARSLNNLGAAYYHKGQYDQAAKYIKDGLNIRRQIYKKDPHPGVATSLNNLGLAHHNKGQYDEAIKYLEDGLEMIKLIYKEEPHQDVANSINNLGNAYGAKGQYDQAIKYFEVSLKMLQLIHKDEPDIDVADSLNSLGNAYIAKGQYDHAFDYFVDSLKMVKLIHKEEPHPHVAGCLHNLGLAHHNKGQYDQAIKYYKDCLKIRKLIYKEEPHPDVARSLNNLGLTNHYKGQFDEAIKYYENTINMMKLIYKEEPHPDVAIILNNQGLLFSAKRQNDQAIKYFEDSIKMMKLIYKEEPHPLMANSLNNLVNAYRNKGQYDQAINYSNQALEMISIFKDHPYINLIKNNFINTTLLFIRNSSSVPQEISKKLIELTGESYLNIELWRAVEQCDKCKIQELITAGVDLDYMPFMTTATTPLIRAIVKGDVEMVALISGNANINKPDNDQNKASPLYYSLGYGGQPVNLEIVMLLLDKGADVSQAMYDGDTPMHMAHYKGNKDAIKILISCKADINAKNDEGKTPLHCLLEKENLSTETKLEIIRDFYQICDDKTIKDQEGNVVIDATQYHSLKLELFFTSK